MSIFEGNLNTERLIIEIQARLSKYEISTYSNSKVKKRFGISCDI